MRQISHKRRARMDEARPFRESLIERVGHCEACGLTPIREVIRLSVHEIANGVHRQKALDKPYAVLVTCWQCNSGQLMDKSKWPESRQLAALAQSRPADFDLEAYLWLTNPNAPRRIELREVFEWIEFGTNRQWRDWLLDFCKQQGGSHEDRG